MKKVISIIIMSLFLCQGCVQEKQDMVSKISLQEKSMAKIITTEVAFNKTKEQYLGNVVYDDIFSVFYFCTLCAVQKKRLIRDFSIFFNYGLASLI